MFNKLIRHCAVIAALILPLQSQAVLISTSIGDYEVTTILTGFNDSEALLKSQVWWEDRTLAEEFAGLVTDLFGTPNLGIYAPFFWYTDTDTIGPCAGINEPYAGIFWDHRANRTSPVCAATAPRGPFTFAVAQAVSVPEPTSATLFGLGIAGLVLAARRRKTNTLAMQS